MSTFALLLPSLSRTRAIPGVAAGVLARWLARGDALASMAPGREAVWRSVFDWSGRDWPVAALTRESDRGDATGAHWLRADPAHVRADMTTARMLACGALGLSIDETDRLARDLKPLFGDAGFLFEADTSERWTLRALAGSELPTGADPDDVLGDDLKLHLPAGAAGRRWRLLFNEAQVLLHNHPVNAERERRGAVAVNSLWFWGGGALPARATSAYARLLADGDSPGGDPALRMLARLAGLHGAPPTPDALGDALAARADTIVDLGALRDAALESDWLGPIDTSLRRGRIEQVYLVFASGERVGIRRAHRWRVWRRVPSPAP